MDGLGNCDSVAEISRRLLMVPARFLAVEIKAYEFEKYCICRERAGQGDGREGAVGERRAPGDSRASGMSREVPPPELETTTVGGGLWRRTGMASSGVTRAWCVGAGRGQEQAREVVRSQNSKGPVGPAGRLHLILPRICAAG